MWIGPCCCGATHTYGERLPAALLAAFPGADLPPINRDHPVVAMILEGERQDDIQIEPDPSDPTRAFITMPDPRLSDLELAKMRTVVRAVLSELLELECHACQIARHLLKPGHPQPPPCPHQKP